MENNENENKVGLTIDIPEELHESIKALSNEQKHLEISGRRLLKEANERSEQLWDLIKDKMPETEGYHMSMNHKDMRISFLGKRKY